MRLLHVTRSLFAIAALLACADETERTEYQDQGAACLTADTNGTLQVTVQIASCLSSSCSTVSDNTCTLQRADNQIILTSHAIIETNQDGPCTDDCRTATAQCTLEGVPAGTYTIVHGDDTETLELPTPGAMLFDPRGRSICDPSLTR